MGQVRGLFVIFGGAVVCCAAFADEPLLQFEAADARQGVAVDAAHVYVIDNTVVAKHDKFTGLLIKRWESDASVPLIHLNSGVIKDGKLYVAHSNYPNLPMMSSVEIWDADSLEHIGTQSFGETDESLTWMDWYDGHWWGCFAHYDGRGGEPGKDHAQTRLVQYDADWNEQAAWKFPDAVLERFAPHSSSGGSWGSDGLLYVTGHDRPELYALRIPEAGAVLEHAGTVPFPNEGQAIAFDRSGTGLVYGIIRSQSLVIAAPVPEAEPESN